MRKNIDRGDRVILWALLAFTLFFRLATLMMIHTGVDERDYWYSAKALSQGLPYPAISHRTTRFAVILPVALAQLVLGVSPDVYYVMPILCSLAQVALAFIVGLRLRGRLTGFLAGLGLAVFPYMIRAGSQVRPEIFSITYILAAFLFFVEYFEREKKDLPPLLVSTAFLFIAYEAKITNLFFVPGMMAAIAIYKKKISHAALLGGILLLLFAAETGAYALFSNYKYGELQIILQNHFHADSETYPRLIDLLGRYSSENLQAYWRIPFAFFAAAAVFYLIRGRDRRVRILVISSLSFFLFLTLEVKSLNPITPAESFINRYFSAVLGPVFLVLAFAAEGLVARLSARLRSLLSSPGALAALLGFFVILSACLFSLPSLPRSIRAYANSPLEPQNHPLALNTRYAAEINAACAGGRGIVADSGDAGSDAIATCEYYFIDKGYYVHGAPPADRAFRYLGRDLRVLGALPSDQGDVLAVVRKPFRIETVKAASLAVLGGESFDDPGLGRDDESDDGSE